MKLKINNLLYSYNSNLVLNKVNFMVESKITALIGPNAAGKSTLLKCMAGVLDPKGTMSIDGNDMKCLNKNELINLRSFLPQESKINASLTVFETLLLGMAPTLSWKVSEKDLEAVSNVLNYLGIEDLALKNINELSGGQKKLVFIAQSLIRNPKLLLMDEPTNGLDLQHQLELFELIQKITLEKGMITIIALHDLNLAARYADNVVVMRNGEIYASGSPSSVLTRETIESVYGVTAHIRVDDDEIPWIKPIRSIRNENLNSGHTRNLVPQKK